MTDLVCACITSSMPETRRAPRSCWLCETEAAAPAYRRDQLLVGVIVPSSGTVGVPHRWLAVGTTVQLMWIIESGSG